MALRIISYKLQRERMSKVSEKRGRKLIMPLKSMTKKQMASIRRIIRRSRMKRMKRTKRTKVAETSVNRHKKTLTRS